MSTNDIDKSNYIIDAFLDIKRAFDIVDLNLSIRKLYYAGIRGNILNLIKSYLNDRTQIVRVNGEFSKVNNTSIGSSKKVLF